MRLAATLIVAQAFALAGCRPCEDVEYQLAEACLFPTMSSDVELTLEVAFSEICGRNCAAPPSCAAIVEHNRVTLVTSRVECEDEGANRCVPDDVCRHETATCTIPRLPPGLYTVTLPGLGAQSLTTEPGAAAHCGLSSGS